MVRAVSASQNGLTPAYTNDDGSVTVLNGGSAEVADEFALVAWELRARLCSSNDDARSELFGRRDSNYGKLNRCNFGVTEK